MDWISHLHMYYIMTKKKNKENKFNKKQAKQNCWQSQGNKKRTQIQNKNLPVGTLLHLKTGVAHLPDSKHVTLFPVESIL